MSHLHRIVIIGGGVAGLELVTLLGNSLGKSKKAQIILVDQKLTHVWKPLLHDVASGSLNPDEEATNYFLHAAKHGYEFILAKFVALDAMSKKIILNNTQVTKHNDHISEFCIHYNTLVFALGSISNDFGTLGAKEYCYFLDTIEQAKTFQHDLLHLYLDTQYHSPKTALNIIIIGASAIGIELAAELSEVKTNLCQYGLHRADPKSIKITLIEATDRIVPVLSGRLANIPYSSLSTLKSQF